MIAFHQAIFDRFQQGIHEQNSDTGQGRLHIQAGRQQTADGGAAPDSGSRGQALDVGALPKDHAGAEEAHSRHHLSDDPGGVASLLPDQDQTENDIHASSYRNQCMRAQSCRLAMPLALETDQQSGQQSQADPGGERGPIADDGKSDHIFQCTKLQVNRTDKRRLVLVNFAGHPIALPQTKATDEMDLGAMRQEFVREGLDRADLDPDPIQQFERWFRQANDGGLLMPNAMSLATVDTDGQPSLRTVLLKFFDERGFVFYTNYGSRKARELEANPKASLLFPWLDLERQVVIVGFTERVSTAESVKYFLSRPRGSQLGAWVSDQSQIITSRQMLLSKFEEMKRKFHEREVPLPSFWGGYRVVPRAVEFWQGRENRLHDRFVYTRAAGDDWEIERLAP